MVSLSQEPTPGIIGSVALIVLWKIRSLIVAADVRESGPSTGDGEIDVADGIEVGAAAGVLASEPGVGAAGGIGAEHQGCVGGGEKGERCGENCGMHVVALDCGEAFVVMGIWNGSLGTFVVVLDVGCEGWMLLKGVRDWKEGFIYVTPKGQEGKIADARRGMAAV